MNPIYYIPSSDSIGWVGGGEITITIPMKAIKDAYRRIRGGIGEEESVEGFFDFAKKALDSVGKVVSGMAKSPLVRAVAGVIPYGSTALEVVAIADDVIGKARKAIAKKPATHGKIRAALKGDPAARAVIAALPPKAKAAVKKAAVLQKESFKLKGQLAAAKKALEQAGYTPSLIRALRIQRAPWAR